MADSQEHPEMARAPVTAARPRLDSVDLLRGLIMVLMALDHTRDFFTNVPYDPLDLTQTSPALFMTRWLTHYCAPVFIFLAGAGASLSRIRGKGVKELSWFLLTRGVWLAFLEVTWVNCLGWSFNFDLRQVGVGVLWAIGWSMVVLAGLIWLPVRAVGAFGIALILLHNLTDGIKPAQFGSFAWLWTILHSPGTLYRAPGWSYQVGYVLIPWMGVMAAGYAFGHVYAWDAAKRKRWLVRAGLAVTAAFVVIRGINHYGNPRPWGPQDGLLNTLFAFVDCHKYPPSLDYVLMTLGPALIVLALLEKGTPKILEPFLVFGRVPLFYYLLHLPMLHGMAVLVALARHGRADWLFHSPFTDAKPPPDAGFGLSGVYFFWLLAVVMLYPVCRWFAGVKARRRDPWLSYF